jgi:hypothetical protein
MRFTSRKSKVALLRNVGLNDSTQPGLVGNGG